MGKIGGFLEYERKGNEAVKPLERIKNYNEFHEEMNEDARKEQGARCMNCGVPFCQAGMSIGGAVSGCPLHNLIPEWNDEIFNGCWGHALSRLLKTNNFPEFTGRVCPALCEAACTCGLNGDAVTVRENELALIEYAYKNNLIEPKPPAVRSGKKVAVIGSGPSGLAVADQLNKRGHEVTVYEREDRIGGLLMYGIPNMKLEKTVIDRRVDIMRAEGVEFVTGADVGRNVSAEEITDKFDAVVLCCGAKNPRDIKVENRDSKGVYFAVDYLTASTKAVLAGTESEKSAKGKKVVIVGGGDTGNDCVGTAIRQGAVSVIQLEMMPCPPEKRAANNPWPQWPRVKKTDYGQEEAIACFGSDPRIYQTTVKKLIPDENGNLKAIVIMKLEPKKDETTGRINMLPIEGTEETIEADMLLIAAGFLGSEAYVSEAFKTERDARTNIASKQGSFATNMDKIFTAGDAHRGQSLVVWAIAEGRACAKEVDAYLEGYSNL